MQPCLPVEPVPRGQWLYGVFRLNIGKNYAIIFSFQSLGTACQLHLWRHLKDPLSVWGRQLTRQLAIAPENEMLYQGKEIS